MILSSPSLSSGCSNSKPTIQGVITARGEHISGAAVVLATGTFLDARVHIGKTSYPAGRHKRDSAEIEAPCIALSHTLQRLAFPLRYFTTGTPPRLAHSTIDYSALSPQHSDDPPRPFSFLNTHVGIPQSSLIPTYLTHTTQKTHEIIAANRHTLPSFRGNAGAGKGPRNCPAIEKKVHRFPDKSAHPVWLEREGLDPCNTVYPQGLNNGFPPEVQLELLRSIPGLERVEIIRPAYAVEYQCMDARVLLPTLECKGVSGLFASAQLLGSTGYEEAAGQGLVAGANAAAKILGRPPLLLHRYDSYIGVMISDLTERGGVTEAYRLFTSRAEWRLSLRADNADLRLTRKGRDSGIVDDARWAVFTERERSVKVGLEALSAFKAPNSSWMSHLPGYIIGQEAPPRTAREMLSTPHVTLEEVVGAVERMEGDEIREGQGEGDATTKKPALGGLLRAASASFPNSLSITTEVKYGPYLVRQAADIQAFRESEGLTLPLDVDYTGVEGISKEEAEVLNRDRPFTLGAAKELPHIRPTSLLVLMGLAKEGLRKAGGGREKNSVAVPAAPLVASSTVVPPLSTASLGK